MGRPKLVLPWGGTTVLGQVISNLRGAGLDQILVVTGGARLLVETEVALHAGRCVYNPDHASQGMLGSVQCGLRMIPSICPAALIVLGDQPQVQPATIRRICGPGLSQNCLVVPSSGGRWGHPWLLGRAYWHEVLALHSPQTLRDFLHRQRKAVTTLVFDDENILADLDTMEDYLRFRPG